MAALNFPDPSVTQEFEAAGILWTWNAILGVWSSETTTAFDAGELYLSKRNDDAADGNIEFKGLTTHQQGVQLPNLTNTAALATDVDGNIIAGTGGGGSAEFLSKVNDDTAAGQITFEKLTTYKNGVNVTNGKVGIGTTSPDFALSVDASNTATIQVKSSGDTSSQRAARLVYGFSDGDGASINSVRTTGGPATDANLSFRVGGVTNTVQRMVITSSGNVGIGNAFNVDPAAKLDVKGDALFASAEVNGSKITGETNTVHTGIFSNSTCGTVSAPDTDYYQGIRSDMDANNQSLKALRHFTVASNYNVGNCESVAGFSVGTQMSTSLPDNHNISVYGARFAVKEYSGLGTGEAFNLYINGTAPNYFKGDINCDGSVNGTFSLRMQSDDPAAFQSAFSIDDEGNQVENQEYIGTTEDLLSIIKDLRARVAALEGAAGGGTKATTRKRKS